MSASPTTQPTLVRGIGLAAAASIVVGNVIGTGVFLKARVMTCNVGSPTLVLGAWVAAGVLSLAGALAYAELAAMLPRAGGDYVYLREAYGRRWAVMYGWMQTSVGYTGSMAAKAVAFAIFLNAVTGGAIDRQFFAMSIAGHAVSFGGLQLVALLSIAGVALVNCAAVRVTGGLSIVLTAVKIGIVLAIGVGTFFFAKGDWTHFSMAASGGACEGMSAAARSGITGFGAAMLGALWAYDGWSNVALLGGEVKRPERNLPIALIGGMVVVIVLYVLVNTSYFFILTPTEVANVSASSSVATESVAHFLGPVAVSTIAASMLVSTLGSFHATVMSGSRIPYAMAKDGLFFERFGRLSARSQVPVWAILAMAVWASVLVFSGSFDTLTDYVIFGSWLFYAMTTGALFIFRRRMPDAERPYRTWGYPVVPILFLLVAGWLIVNTMWTTPAQAFMGIFLIALGLPLYWYWSRDSAP